MRFRNAVIATVGLPLPLLVSWAVLVYTHRSFADPKPMPTPNPAMIPAQYLGPSAWLVYYDPWFAGVFGVLFYPWCAIYAAAIAAAGALKPAGLSKRPVMLFLTALAIGSALAGPWLYFAARELTR